MVAPIVRLRIQAEMLGESGYRKVIATRINGFSKQFVLVDNQEYEQLDPEVRVALIQDIEA